eukprot:6190682-Pleurochrysis_carterae.AAC.1
MNEQLFKNRALRRQLSGCSRFRCGRLQLSAHSQTLSSALTFSPPGVVSILPPGADVAVWEREPGQVLETRQSAQRLLGATPKACVRRLRDSLDRALLPCVLAQRSPPLVTFRSASLHSRLSSTLSRNTVAQCVAIQ